MQRGVERRTTFLDDADRADFLRRLDEILPDEGVRCLAWVLMPNHFHLVVQTGARPLWKALHRLGTGYSMRFNHRYDRVGHLVQNRFRSRPARDDEDVKNLIRYVHRNPLRAKIVASVDQLVHDPWNGHGALMGAAPARRFHATTDALAYLGDSIPAARAALRNWMLEIETIDSDLAPLDRLSRARSKICGERGVSVADLEAGVRDRAVSRVRRELAVLAVVEMQLPTRAIAKLLGASPSAIARAART